MSFGGAFLNKNQTCVSNTHITSIQYKLMQLASPNRIDVVESNLKSESERRIIVDSDSNDLIEYDI